MIGFSIIICLIFSFSVSNKHSQHSRKCFLCYVSIKSNRRPSFKLWKRFSFLTMISDLSSFNGCKGEKLKVGMIGCKRAVLASYSATGKRTCHFLILPLSFLSLSLVVIAVLMLVTLPILAPHRRCHRRTPHGRNNLTSREKVQRLPPRRIRPADSRSGAATDRPGPRRTGRPVNAPIRLATASARPRHWRAEAARGCPG